MKVYYLTNAPTPYKRAFWEELGSYCELIVLLEVNHSKERDNSWKNKGSYGYTEHLLPFLFRNKNGAYCPSIRKYIKQSDGIFIINGYNTLTGMYSIWFCRRHQLQYIISSDGGLIKPESKLVYYLKKYLLKDAFAYLSSGKVTDEYLIHYGVERKKIGHYPFTSVSSKQIPMQIVSDFEKKHIREEIGITEDKMVLSVGQFIYRKGIDILLRACANIDHQVGIYIIGGEPTEEYKQIVTTNRLTNIHFISFIQPEELKQYYIAADFFVLPTREDIWGLVINEAMSYGLPVITTNRCVAGLEMIRNGDTGILINTDDVTALTHAIHYLLQNAEKRREMSINALYRAREYTIEEMAKQTFEFLNDQLRLHQHEQDGLIS